MIRNHSMRARSDAFEWSNTPGVWCARWECICGCGYSTNGNNEAARSAIEAEIDAAKRWLEHLQEIWP